MKRLLIAAAFALFGAVSLSVQAEVVINGQLIEGQDLLALEMSVVGAQSH